MDPTTPTRRFSLAGKDAGTAGIEFDNPILVGRESSVTREGQQLTIDLVVSSPMVSGLHARISPDEEGLLVEDLGSTNGTFVNDQRVSKPVRARHGDEVRFDKIIFTVNDRKPAPKPAPSPAATAPKGTQLSPESIKAPEPVKAPVPVKAPEPVVDPEPGGKMGGTVLLDENKGLPKMLQAKPGTQLLETGDLPARRRAAEELQALEDQTLEPTLWFLSGPASGSGVRLSTDGAWNFWNIGSDPKRNELSIVVNDNSVSGLHAKLVHRDKRWKLIDLAATNPVLVNGERRNPAFLHSKDQILLGRVECLFLLPKQGAASAGKAGGTTFTGWRWVLLGVLIFLIACVIALTLWR